jgi:uncharacterized protein
VLILVPPSESKAPPPEHGRGVDLDALSFPELADLRRQMLGALALTSAEPDAFARLYAPVSKVAEVARNTYLVDVPAIPVLDVYTGPLHEGLDAAGLSAHGRTRAEEAVVVTSPVFGALRPRDRIPSYRCHPCARLVGIGRLEASWRRVLPATLAGAAGDDGVIVDLRSPQVRALGMPMGAGERTIVLRVDQGRRGHRIGDVVAKRVRGEAAHELLESGDDPGDPEALADLLADRWPVRLDAPKRRGDPWTMTLTTGA